MSDSPSYGLPLGTAQVIRANSRHLPLADNSVDLVVTSPPYFALRSYQDGGEHYAGQIGDEPTPAEFVDSLLEVTRECVRVLKPSGSLWVNLGDKYVADNRGSGVDVKRGEAKHAPRGPLGFITGGMRQKSLMGIPWRYALRCIDDLGLILRAEVIWSKPNGLPESVTDRVRRSHEQWFHFTLEPRYFSAVDEIREPHLEPDRKRADMFGGITGTNGVRHAGASTYTGPTNPLGKLPGSVWTVPTEPLRVPDHLGIDHFAAFPTEWPKRIIQGWSPIGVCVECGEGRRPVASREQRARRPIGESQMHTAYDARADKGTRSNIGHVVTDHAVVGYECACGSSTAALSRSAISDPASSSASPLSPSSADSHAATAARACATHSSSMARTLPPTRPAVVLDPFGGTGTTAMVAKALGRHGISVDMSADYCRLAEWRTNDRDQLAKVLGVAKADAAHADEQSLLDLLDGVNR